LIFKPDLHFLLHGYKDLINTFQVIAFSLEHGLVSLFVFEAEIDISIIKIKIHQYFVRLVHKFTCRDVPIIFIVDDTSLHIITYIMIELFGLLLVILFGELFEIVGLDFFIRLSIFCILV